MYSLRSFYDLLRVFRATAGAQRKRHLFWVTPTAKCSGPPDTLGSLNNLANLFDNKGKCDRALECLTKRKRVLGKDHPDTLGSPAVRYEIIL